MASNDSYSDWYDWNPADIIPTTFGDYSPTDFSTPYYSPEDVPFTTIDPDTGFPASPKKVSPSSSGTSPVYRIDSGSRSSGYRSNRETAASEPSYPELPTYTAPTYDESRVSSLAQENAAPGLRRARRAIQDVMGRRYENPNVRRMTLREALAGYGEALTNIYTGAKKEARQEYATEYATKVNEAQQNWKAGVEAKMTEYANKYKAYLKGL